MSTGWDESKHPRVPSGQSTGGQFANANQGELFGSDTQLGQAPEKLDWADDSYDAEELLNQTVGNNGPPGAYGMNRLTQDELKAFDEYTGTGYGDINGYLRGTQDYEPENYDPDQVEEMIGDMDRVFNRSRLPKDMLVYRAVSANTYSKIIKSDSFTDAGYGSTTSKRAFAEQWPKPGRVVVPIVLRKGAKAIPIESISQMKDEGEREILLARGSEFKVRKTVSGQVYLELAA